MELCFNQEKIKNKTGRPSNIRKDLQGEERFKKIVFRSLKQRYREAIYYVDEMRSGTRTQCKQRGSRRRRRPLCRMKVGYEFCYLYATLCPSTGHLVCLILPDMTKASFCVFCSFFSAQVRALWGSVPVLMIAVGAGHTKGKCVFSRASTCSTCLPTARS